MVRKAISILLSLFFLVSVNILITPFDVLAEGASANPVDFVRSQIWFSKQPFYAGDQVKIYTGIFNGSSADTRGRVEFYGNQKLLGIADFSLVFGTLVGGTGAWFFAWLDWRILSVRLGWRTNAPASN